MLQGWVAIVIALAYIGFLFLVASYGDRRKELVRGSRARLLIYPLSLAIYCTSWTFFGSVGVAARTGFDFLTIYIGPVLMVGLGWPLIVRIARLAKAQNITSIADFIAARYGKSQAVAATVALIAIVGMIPYIALQLKAVSASVETILAAGAAGNAAAPPVVGDIALFVALLMAAFGVLFGTRHTDATEHQDGLMLAIAAESIIKLVAFLAVGVFVSFVMFPGPAQLLADAWRHPQAAAALTRAPQAAGFAAMTVLSLFAIVLLPRQFHVAIVENHSEAEIRRAAWLFPLYLVLINLFVMPIARRRFADVPGRRHRRGYVRAGVAAQGALAIIRGDCVHRRPIGRDRNGDCRDGGARHHGIERHCDTACARASRRSSRGVRQRRGAASYRAPHRNFRHPVSCLRLLPFRRPSSALRHRAVVVCRHCPVGAGGIWRTPVAARDRGRRHRGDVCRYRGLGLHAVAAKYFRRRHRDRRTVRRRLAAAARPVRPAIAAARSRRCAEPIRQYRLLYRLLALEPADGD